jgi:hypothetical protein
MSVRVVLSVMSWFAACALLAAQPADENRMVLEVNSRR